MSYISCFIHARQAEKLVQVPYYLLINITKEMSPYHVILYYLREFGVKLSVIAAPLREVPWPVPAVLVRGRAGNACAQTLRFSGFHACPPAPLAFNAFLDRNRALRRVWRTCVLQTSVFIEWIGP